MDYRQGRLPFSPWWLVAAGALAMGVAGTYQFVWSSIREPLGTRVGVSGAPLGAVYTLYVVFQTTSQFPAGWVRDRYGPRVPTVAGAVLLAAGFAGAAFATDLWLVYLSFAVGGVGVGSVYTVSINTPVKWFDERRGLATGIIGMAFGLGSFLLIPFVRGAIDSAYVPTVLGLGILAGVGTLVTVPLLRDPERYGSEDDKNGSDDRDGQTAESRSLHSESYTWRETVRTWQFWLLYGVFVVVNAVGLMLIAKVVTFAQELGLSAAIATGSASLVALADAGGVVVGGAASDRFGEERTVAASLVCCGGVLALAVALGAAGIGVGFVALAAGAAFFRSPPFAVFPSIVGRYYGRAHSSENYAVLYTAKLWGGVGGGAVASLSVTAVGWSSTFLGGAALVSLAGVALLFVTPVGGDEN